MKKLTYRPTQNLNAFNVCLLVTAAILFGLPEKAAAKEEAPFKARFVTEVSATPAPPLLYLEITGEGQASHMGRTFTYTDNQVVNLITGAATATYTLVAANGDKVVVAIELQANFVADGVTFAGTYVVTGGTGRFSGATGSGALHGAAVPTSATAHIGWFEMAGSLTSPGA